MLLNDWTKHLLNFLNNSTNPFDFHWQGTQIGTKYRKVRKTTLTHFDKGELAEFKETMTNSEWVSHSTHLLVKLRTIISGNLGYSNQTDLWHCNTENLTSQHNIIVWHENKSNTSITVKEHIRLAQCEMKSRVMMLKLSWTPMKHYVRSIVIMFRNRVEIHLPNNHVILYVGIQTRK